MWQTELVVIVRHMINDVLTPSTYPDQRLQELILVAGQLTQQNISFPNIYNIDLDLYQLSPDPTAQETRDDGFINLVCLKSAAIMTMSEFKIAAGQGIAIKDGASSIDLKGVALSKQKAAEFYKEAFDEARYQYMAGDRCAGESVVSPFRLNTYNYQSYNNIINSSRLPIFY